MKDIYIKYINLDGNNAANLGEDNVLFSCPLELRKLHVTRCKGNFVCLISILLRKATNKARANVSFDN